MNQQQSERLFARAQQLMPGGVNSPVRAFGSVEGNPPFMQSGQGATIRDEDGNEFIDFVASGGSLILGHAHPEVVAAAQDACGRGSTFGAPTRSEVDLAEAIVEAYPSIEMLRLVSSGTEAVMSALRLARAATGRDRIVKFEGCYHGHSDGLLARAGSGLATLGIPDVPGVPASFAIHTTTLPYNDIGTVREFMATEGNGVAAVIVEPVAGNMGVVPPREGFLEGLRDLTRAHETLLIFDEVITGCRVARGGAQERFGMNADLTVLGKIIGGGFPLAAYGGRRDLMERVAPSGPVYQAGTLSGNPVATAAGLATLSLLDTTAYEKLEALGQQFENGLREAARSAGRGCIVQRVGSMLTLFLTGTVPVDFASVKRTDASLYGRMHWRLLEQGIYFPPSAYEAMFVSTAHTPAHIDAAVAAVRRALEAG